MREVGVFRAGLSSEDASFLACLATILELNPDEVPDLPAEDDLPRGRNLSRWLGGSDLGIVPVDEPESFTWPGPWIAGVRDEAGRRFVVMYGVPSAVVWDPLDSSIAPGARVGITLEEGFVVAPCDVALARSDRPAPPLHAGRLESIHVSASAGAEARTTHFARVFAGRGLDGDRHLHGRGTFPSGLRGSALTLIEAEVCESFDPTLGAEEHRRNLVTRGIGLNALVGRDFTIGTVHCRGVRLCEPCAVIEGYARRPVLRALVHRGGLRADILNDGAISVGDEVVAVGH